MEILKEYINYLLETRRTKTRVRGTLARKLAGDVLRLIISSQDNSPVSGDLIYKDDPDIKEGSPRKVSDGARAGTYDWPFELDLSDDEVRDIHPEGAGIFSVDVKILRDVKPFNDSPLEFDVYATTGIDYAGTANIEMMIHIFKSIREESEIYRDLYGEVRDSLRHEIRHLSQQGPLKSKDDSLDDSDAEEGTFGYFVSPSEIPAFVEGLYDASQYNKTTIDKEMIEYLKNHLLPRGKISQDEMMKIYRTWISWATTNLPHARYEKEDSPKTS